MQFPPQQMQPFAQNPFAPVLFEAVTPYTATVEQERLIRGILALSSSDSAFAQKALDAIKIVLAGGASKIPVLSSIVPSTKPAGSATFLFECIGTGFDSTCVIHIAGNAVPTAFVSENKLTSNINLVGVTSPTIVPVNIRNVVGVVSNSVNFTVTAPAALAPPKPPFSKDEPVKDAAKEAIREPSIAEKHAGLHGK